MFYNLEFSFWYLFLGSILTYLVWGFIVAFEVVLGMGGSKIALSWIKKHHTYKLLYKEVAAFYPMILVVYLFLELIPHYIFKEEPLIKFDLDKLFEDLYADDR
ncbi:hypothetical protein [Sulfurimonas sp. HSL-1716]|uniref:hypothetical protein n=1 Tax=Hydrocurvibacter sulfurireducens TaxID=3131937 RepID=UPI0031F802AE